MRNPFDAACTVCAPANICMPITRSSTDNRILHPLRPESPECAGVFSYILTSVTHFVCLLITSHTFYQIFVTYLCTNVSVKRFKDYGFVKKSIIHVRNYVNTSVRMFLENRYIFTNSQ